MGLIIKNGVIYNGAESEPVVYSLDEREVGVWTDGKPLYKRTLAYTKSDISNGDNTITHGISNFGISPWLEGLVIYIDGNCVTLPAIGANNDWSARAYDFGTTTFALTIGSGMYNNLKTSGYAIFITVYYTKTTDTPGSGTWTPSGVKAEHYSTNEHVVGTYIDGKTVYERTINVDSPTKDNWVSMTDTSTWGIDTVVELVGAYKRSWSGGYSQQAVPYYESTNVYASLRVHSNGQFQYRLHDETNNSVSDLKATIRYTKTT